MILGRAWNISWLCLNGFANDFQQGPASRDFSQFCENGYQCVANHISWIWKSIKQHRQQLMPTYRIESHKCIYLKQLSISFKHIWLIILNLLDKLNIISRNQTRCIVLDKLYMCEMQVISQEKCKLGWFENCSANAILVI